MQNSSSKKNNSYNKNGYVTLPAHFIIKINNECKIYVDIMAGGTCRQFSFLTWNSFKGQFINPVGEEWMGDR